MDKQKDCFCFVKSKIASIIKPEIVKDTNWGSFVIDTPLP